MLHMNTVRETDIEIKLMPNTNISYHKIEKESN